MVKKKSKKQEGIIDLGTGLIGATVVTSVLPNPTNSVAVTTIKGKAVEGFSKVGSKLPILGKIKGTGMVINATKGLAKAHKKFSKDSII